MAPFAKLVPYCIPAIIILSNAEEFGFYENWIISRTFCLTLSLCLPLQATRLLANYIKLDNTDEKVDAMVSLRDTAASVHLYDSDPFAYADSFLDHDGDLVIRKELLRNIGLAMLVVFLLTLVLISNIWSSLLVLVSVVLTLVRLTQFLYLPASKFVILPSFCR